MKKYCGRNHTQMLDVLAFMCELGEDLDLSEKERGMYDIAIQCVATVVNRMMDNKKITFEEE